MRRRAANKRLFRFCRGGAAAPFLAGFVSTWRFFRDGFTRRVCALALVEQMGVRFGGGGVRRGFGQPVALSLFGGEIRRRGVPHHVHGARGDVWILVDGLGGGDRPQDGSKRHRSVQIAAQEIRLHRFLHIRHSVRHRAVLLRDRRLGDEVRGGLPHRRAGRAGRRRGVLLRLHVEQPRKLSVDAAVFGGDVHCRGPWREGRHREGEQGSHAHPHPHDDRLGGVRAHDAGRARPSSAPSW